MIILDTNVLSELMRRAAAPKVVDWIRVQSPESLFTTAVSEAEIFYGLALLARGKRRAALEDAASALFEEFSGRLLPFDSSAARYFGEVVAVRRRSGRPISVPDAEIAAIALSRNARVATRDLEDFALCGVELVSPWSASAED